MKKKNLVTSYLACPLSGARHFRWRGWSKDFGGFEIFDTLFFGGWKIWGIGRNRVSFARDGQSMVSCTGRIKIVQPNTFSVVLFLWMTKYKSGRLTLTNLTPQQVINFRLRAPVELSLNLIETNVKMNTVWWFEHVSKYSRTIHMFKTRSLGQDEKAMISRPPPPPQTPHPLSCAFSDVGMFSESLM